MKVKCIYNTGKALRIYETKSLKQLEFGKFGSSEYTEYNGISVGKQYLVMGMIMFESSISYLIDDNGLIFVYPCQLFEVLENKFPSDWYFRLIEKDEEIYPYIQAICGYYELCFDKISYQNIIIDKDEGYYALYFKRKAEFEIKLAIN